MHHIILNCLFCTLLVYHLNLTIVLFLVFGVQVRLTCLGCNHQSSVAFIVLVIYVYKGTVMKPVYNVHETFAASQHQAILLVILNGKDQ